MAGPNSQDQDLATDDARSYHRKSDPIKLHVHRAMPRKLITEKDTTQQGHPRGRPKRNTTQSLLEPSTRQTAEPKNTPHGEKQPALKRWIDLPEKSLRWQAATKLSRPKTSQLKAGRTAYSKEEEEATTTLGYNRKMNMKEAWIKPTPPKI